MNDIKKSLDKSMAHITFDIPAQSIIDEYNRRRNKKHIALKHVFSLVAAIIAMVSILSVSVSAGALIYRRVTASISAEKQSIGTVVSNVPESINESKISQIYSVEIPDDYIEDSTYTSEILITATYTDGGNTLEFSQRLTSIPELITEEENKATSFIDNGIEYLFYESENINNLLWNENGYSFALRSNELTKDELFKLSLTLEARGER